MALIIVILFAICVLTCFGISISRKSEEDAALLSFDTSNTLKGLAILLVTIHHYGQLASDAYYAHSFLGYLGVTIFFFISGYASQKQLLLKGRAYIGVSFIKKKLIRLYIPYILTILFFAIIGRHGIQATILEIVQINGNWYLTATTIFYLLFMVVNLIALRKSKATTIEAKSVRGGQCAFTVLIILYMIFCIVTNISSTWYGTALAFPIGTYAASYEHYGIAVGQRKNGSRAVDKTALNITFAMSAAAAVAFITLSSARLWSYDVTSTAASFAFAVFIGCAALKFEAKSKVLAFFGGISWEMYMCQPKIIYILKDHVSAYPVLWFVFYIVAVPVFGFLMNRAVNWMRRKIKKKC